MSAEIKFGTSGWRGIMSEDFTFDNVRIVVQAIADFLKTQKNLEGKPVIVGGDARFLSDKFSEAAAEVLAANGISSLVCDRDTPTPVISFEIIRRKAAGGINFTASHNPAQYNGLKFSPAWGGPATVAETKHIEDNLKKTPIEKVKRMTLEEGKKKGLIKIFDPSEFYLKRIKEIVDFSVIKKSKMKIIADPLYATGRGYLDTLLKEAGANVTVINDKRDVLFGGFPPEPAEKNVGDLIAAVKKHKAILGVATDGDGDRYGIIDSDGAYIPANKILALLLDYLMRTRKWKGSVVRSVATSGWIDRVAKVYGLTLHETPVGFKYIGDIMTREEIIIGGEESNGLTVHGHIPEKDGIIACLLVVEMVARAKKSIKQLLKDLEEKVGAIFTDKLNFRLTEEKKQALVAKLKKGGITKIGTYKVENLITLDGHKFMLGNGNWAMVRLSGTEPIVRLYAEAATAKDLKAILKAGEEFINN